MELRLFQHEEQDYSGGGQAILLGLFIVSKAGAAYREGEKRMERENDDDDDDVQQP